MSAAFDYPVENDGHVFRAATFNMGSLALSISACTVQGSKDGIVKKLNEDAFSVIFEDGKLQAAFAYQAMQKSAGSNTASTAKVAASPSPAAADVLMVDKWTIKIELAASLVNAKIKYSERTTSDRPSRTYYAFTTDRIEALGGKCTQPPFGDTAILERFIEKPVATPDGELINNSPINGYYYVVTGPIAPCSDSQVEAQDRSALKSSLKTLSSTNP